MLLISNSRDYATDYVVAEARARGIRYVRLDTDFLKDDALALDPINATLEIRGPQGNFRLTAPDISGVYFRAPTHLSESSGDRFRPEDQIERHQWAAFTRALTVFTDSTWVNHPTETFAAECKPFQLKLAASLGWDVIETVVGNVKPSGERFAGQSELAIKALDTFFTRIGTSDVFFYTQPIPLESVSNDSLRSMPAIFQRFMRDKVDLRVTVVGDECFAAAITCNKTGVVGDWRLQKELVEYRSYELPTTIRSRCINLVRAFGLIFGAIDLMVSKDKYFFVEINPTGEWAWLTQRLGFPIPGLLVDALSGACSDGS